jgi:N-acetylglutamate synthase-like GNAT family acetyltransferase
MLPFRIFCLMIIRLAEKSEYAAVAEQYSTCNYRAELLPNDQIIIAIDKQIVGAVRICMEHDVKVLRGMQVGKEFQRQGVGSQMLQYLSRQVDMAGCYCLTHKHLETFYGQIGFMEDTASTAPEFLLERLNEYLNKGYGEMIAMKCA